MVCTVTTEIQGNNYNVKERDAFSSKGPSVSEDYTLLFCLIVDHPAANNGGNRRALHARSGEVLDQRMCDVIRHTL